MHTSLTYQQLRRYFPFWIWFLGRREGNVPAPSCIHSHYCEVSVQLHLKGFHLLLFWVELMCRILAQHHLFLWVCVWTVAKASDVVDKSLQDLLSLCLMFTSCQMGKREKKRFVFHHLNRNHSTSTNKTAIMQQNNMIHLAQTVRVKVLRKM